MTISGAAGRPNQRRVAATLNEPASASFGMISGAHAVPSRERRTCALGCPGGDLRKFCERGVEPLLWKFDVLELAREVRVVGAEVEVTVARKVEQDHARIARLAGRGSLLRNRAQRVRRLRRGEDSLAA